MDMGQIASTNSSFKMKKLSDADIFLINKEKENDLVANNMNYFSNTTYKVDHIISTLNFEEGNVSPNHLEDLKNGYLYINSPYKKNTANILIVNTRKVLVEYFEYKDVVCYWFFCANKSNTAVVVGRVNFDPGEQVKAKLILDDLIKNLSFKKE
jgi:hypothetical protein